MQHAGGAEGVRPGSGSPTSKTVDAADGKADGRAAHADQPVNLIILAIPERASDIHIEPLSGRRASKYRIDGSAASRNQPGPHPQAAITSRVKIMAGMNIAGAGTCRRTGTSRPVLRAARSISASTAPCRRFTASRW